MVIDTALRPGALFHPDQEGRFSSERGKPSRPGKSKFLSFNKKKRPCFLINSVSSEFDPDAIFGNLRGNKEGTYLKP